MREGQEPVSGLAKRELYFAAGGRTAPFPPQNNETQEAD